MSKRSKIILVSFKKAVTKIIPEGIEIMPAG